MERLRTVQAVKDYYHSHGYRMIPLEPGQKFPRFGYRFDDSMKPDYDFEVKENDNIGMLHGETSGTFAIDIDFKDGKKHTVEEALRVVSDDPDVMLEKTLIIRTPKQGVHIIYRVPDHIYPLSKVYTSREFPNVNIDVKSTKGYTVFPPSLHPEGFGNYEFVSKTLEPVPLSWKDAETVLHARGFNTVQQQRAEPDHRKYDYTLLVAGKYVRGERRIKQKSLYIQKRIMGSSEEDTLRSLRQINKTCKPPFNDLELKTNCQAAERYYKTVVAPDLEKQRALDPKKPAPSEPKKDMYVMADHIKDGMRLVTDVSGHVYFYKDGVYHRHGELMIRKQCRKYWREIKINTAEINEIVNIIKDTTLIINDEGSEDIFDKDHTKLILKNGTYDFKKNKFIDHDPENLALIKHPVFYNPDAICPKFDAFLSSCFAEDKVRMTQALELMALCFVKKYIIQKGYILYGNGSNGKSTFLKILSKMLGMRNTISIPIQNFQKSQFIGHDLRAKCANISADGGTEPISRTGFLKEVLGGDSVRCEEKYHNAFMFDPFVTMIFTFNEIPVVQDSSDGFARKIQTIHWDQRFTGDRRYNSVNNIATTPAELSGIFNRLVPIITRLLKSNQLSFEDGVKETKTILLSRSDSWYGFERTEIMRGDYKIEVGELREKYEKWCNDEGMTPISANALNSKLRDAGIQRQKTRVTGAQVTMWVGLTTRDHLLEDGQTTIGYKK